jgi:non-ribosomal peptide synthase protein (TIGR01720 family)
VSDLLKRLEQLSSEKRELLEMLMKEEDTGLQSTYVAPSTPVEEVLVTIWGQVLGIERVGIHDNFLELGGDSIQSIRIVAKANQAGLELSTNQLFEHSTIAELAAVVGTISLRQAQQEPVIGPVPLTPIQQWFFEQNFPEPHHWNQAVLLEVDRDLDPSLLEQVSQQLLVHHDALRLRFKQKSGIWQQINMGLEEKVCFSRFDLSKMPESEQKSAIEKIATEIQSSFNLSEGPLMKGAFFELGERKTNRLLLAIHHLVEDVVSLRILLEDLQTAYEQLSNGKAMSLPAKTTSFKQWSELLTEHAQSPEIKQELTYWLAEPRTQAQPLPRDYPEGSNIEASTRIASVSFTQEETQALLQKVPTTYQTQINQVLLTAMVQTISQWTGRRDLLIDLDVHGREEIVEGVNLSRSVGWFTNCFPMYLSLGEAQTPVDALMSIKEQLRQIPKRGIGYGLLRYCCNDKAIAQKMRSLPRPEIIFNYLGQFDRILLESSPFQLQSESHGLSISPRNTRPHLLLVLGRVFEGRLQMNWEYSENIYRQSTVENLAQRFMEELHLLLAQ